MNFCPGNQQAPVSRRLAFDGGNRTAIAEMALGFEGWPSLGNGAKPFGWWRNKTRGVAPRAGSVIGLSADDRKGVQANPGHPTKIKGRPIYVDCIQQPARGAMDLGRVSDRAVVEGGLSLNQSPTL